MACFCSKMGNCMSSFPNWPQTLKFFVIVFQHEYIFHRSHIYPTHLFWDETYNITLPSLHCFLWCKLLNYKLFKTPATENYFLRPDKHFLTAGLLNSLYYFCVLCYKQCRWSSLVIFLHQSSFRFVCCCFGLVLKKRHD